MTTHNTAVVATDNYKFPTRIWHGASLRDLMAMGLTSVGGERDGLVECTMPEGWAIVESGVSPYQRRLVDAQGNVRAKLYYQSGSSGGAPEMELSPGGEVKAYLPAKVWHGASLQDLRAFGVVPTGKTAKAGLNDIVECELPLGWRIVESGVSPFQTRLVDALGRVRARIFSQPGSAGGGMEMEIVPLNLH